MSISIDPVKKLLIIDDDPDVRELLRRLLNGPDYKLSFASTGADGLAKAAELMPDLILLDVLMPGMDGFTVCRSLRETPALADIPIILLDGNIIPAEVDIGRFVWETKPLAQLIVRDITERRRAEVALRQSQQRFHALFEYAPDAIFMLAHDGIIRDVNPAACRLYGMSQERLIGQQMADLLLLDRRAVAAQYFFTLAHAEIDRVEGLCTTADGRTLSVEVQASPIENAGAAELLLFVRDITEHKQLEAQLAQAQRMEGLGRLASGVAHDLNNLLTVIGGYTSLALDQLAPVDALYNDLYEIRTVVERASRLTHQLLAFGRQHVIETQILNLNDQILDLGKLLCRLVGKDIELVYKLAPDLASIKADPSQIEQLVINLVINARDAMPNGGTVQIETHNCELGHTAVQRVPGAAQPAAVCLVISDTGVGMDDVVKRRLFEMFYTTKALGQGTGVGLATWYTIVKQHGGHIEVDSEVGQGSIFTIYLPAVGQRER
jgi:PAS domain S-box-containing protein